MAAPTSYTEATFKAFLENQLTTAIGKSLSWTVAGGDFDEIVNEVELVMGGAIATLTAIRSLRAVGRRELWRTVMQASTNKATAATGVAGSIAFGKTIFDRAQELYKQAAEDVDNLLADSQSNNPFQVTVA